MTGDDDLEQFFSAARQARPAPSEALTARVLADAVAVQAARAAPAARRPRPLAARFSAFFGTGGALAGLAAASVAGFWIGAVQPDLAGAFWQGDAVAVDLIPSLNGLLADVED
mgnify:CR=1 FL=1